MFYDTNCLKRGAPRLLVNSGRTLSHFVKGLHSLLVAMRLGQSKVLANRVQAHDIPIYVSTNEFKETEELKFARELT